MEVDVESKPISRLERRLAGRFVRTFFFRNRRAGPWPVPDWLPHRRFTFAGNTGATLAGRWFPHSRPNGTVVLLHPDRRYGQHWFVHAGWVDFLHDRGFHVFTFDFPDFGESRGGSTYYHEDAIAACLEARRLAPGLPLHAIGLSMGSFALMNAAPQLDFVESVVLESPYPSFKAWYGRGPGALGMATFDRLFRATGQRIKGDQNLARARWRRILIAGSRADQVTPIPLTRAVAAVAAPERTRIVEFDGIPHLALFTESETYRTAVLETLTTASDSGPLNATRVPAARPAARLRTQTPQLVAPTVA